MSVPNFNPWLDGFSFEVHCPGNGYAMNYIWKEAVVYSGPPGAEGRDKIRGGYDYNEPFTLPTSSNPHSACAGDYFISENGEIFLASRR